MLKHQNIIDKMTLKQKLAYLASGHMPEEVYDVPSVSVADLKAADIFPPVSAANSWDPLLFAGMGEYLGTQAKTEGANIAFTPDLSLRINPYENGISEDPHLCGVLMAEFAKGAARAGVVPVLSACRLSDAETAFMDIFPDNRILSDYVARPFEAAFNPSQTGGIEVSDASLSGKYKDVNSKLAQTLKKTGAKTVSRQSADAAAGLRAGNVLILNGDAGQLENAHENYVKNKEALEKGKISLTEFENLSNNTQTLTEYDLDTGVDKLLDFAFECKKRAESSVKDGEKSGFDFQNLRRRTAEGSAVLLKNKGGILPLAAATKLAVIGPSASGFARILNQKEGLPFEYMGCAEGYSLSGERNDTTLSEAVSLAYSASAVLLLLEPAPDGTEEGNLFKLPANRLAIADALCKTRRNVIAVISGGHACDVSFDNDCSASLFMPLDNDDSLNTLYKILSGETNPSGRLGFSLYDAADELFDEVKNRKNLGRNKIGPFFGYRGYGCSKMTAKYPFGHGLSYTSFVYSKLKADANKAEFVVKNNGKKAGFEVVQVYVAKKSSSIIRPIKELKGFKKIYLNPGESRVVTIGFNINDLRACDPSDGERKLEGGEYTAFAGASALDIRLATSFTLQGERFVGKKERLSDYIDTESNIISGKYVIEEAKDKKKAFLAMRILSIIALCLAGIYDLLFGASVGMGSKSGPAGYVILVLLNLLVPAAITLLVIDSKRRTKFRAAAAQPSPENETEINGRPALEKLFLAEFAETESQTDKNKQTGYQSGNTVEINKNDVMLPTEDAVIPFADSSLTLKTAAEQIAAFLSERGMSLESAKIRAFLSAMYSSRVIAVTDADTEATENFVKHLCAYFGTEFFSDYVAQSLLGQSETKYFESGIESGAALSAMAEAIRNKHLIHFAVIRDYVFPKEAPPANLWYVYIPRGAKALDGVPSQLAETAAVIELRPRTVAGKDEKTLIFGPGCGQFLKLSEKSEKQCAAGENLWKKIDKLEDYVNSRAQFRLSNKQWRGIEKYIAVYLACDASEAEAADSVIAAKILPLIMPMIKSGMGAGGEFSLMLENAFGEGNVPLSLSALKLFNAGAAKEA